MSPDAVACERCGAKAGEPCVMMKCNGFCSATVCDERPHDHELELGRVHQRRLRASASIRLRMKVWTDPDTGTRWLVAGGMASAGARDRIKAYALREGQAKLIELTPVEWNALPWSWFDEADRNVASPGPRPFDLVTL